MQLAEVGTAVGKRRQGGVVQSTHNPAWILGGYVGNVSRAVPRRRRGQDLDEQVDTGST